MKKFLIVSFIYITVLNGNILDVSKIIKKMKYKNPIKTTKFIKKLNNSSIYKKDMIKSPIINNSVIKICKDKPELCSLSRSILSFSNQSKYANRLIKTTDYPIDAIRLNMKYNNKFIDTMEKVGVKINKIEPKDINFLRKKFPNMPQIKFNSIKDINDKMLLTFRYTGKKGWETTQELLKLAKKYPKSATVATLMAWYFTDPTSFFEQKEKLIDFVGSTLEEGVSDITKLTLNASSGVASGFISEVKEKATFSNIMVLLMLFLSFIIWKLRGYIKNYLEQTKTKTIKNKGLL